MPTLSDVVEVNPGTTAGSEAGLVRPRSSLSRLKRELTEMVLRVLNLAAPIPEIRLNELLAPLGGDPANLRRLLVDEGLLDRDPHISVYSLPG